MSSMTPFSWNKKQTSGNLWSQSVSFPNGRCFGGFLLHALCTVKIKSTLLVFAIHSSLCGVYCAQMLPMSWSWVSSSRVKQEHLPRSKRNQARTVSQTELQAGFILGSLIPGIPRNAILMGTALSEWSLACHASVASVACKILGLWINEKYEQFF